MPFKQKLGVTAECFDNVSWPLYESFPFIQTRRTYTGNTGGPKTVYHVVFTNSKS